MRLSVTTRDNWQKSSYSGSGDGNACVEVAHDWQKSPYSGGGEGNDCIEVALGHPRIAVRDSKTPTRAVLTFPAPAFAAFLAALRS
ncbi:DUF397 domain-containing protein [Streptomyces sp. NPDC059906]|uniref:DUF397 domain-containing protein n=1 Tax=Streptomyces sp. NPDC059906 TaxID=3346997 RepID=UPI00365228C0